MGVRTYSMQRIDDAAQTFQKVCGDYLVPRSHPKAVKIAEFACKLAWLAARNRHAEIGWVAYFATILPKKKVGKTRRHPKFVCKKLFQNCLIKF